MAAVDFAVVGAGPAGLLIGLELKRQLGATSFTIFEKGAGSGGTWFWNLYPGCHCDIPSILYSLTSELNPDWSMVCSPQAEILAYFDKIVRDNGLGQHIKTSHEVLGMKWDEQKTVWVMSVRDLQAEQDIEVRAKHVFMCTGQLSRPRLPTNIAGLDSFRGPVFHTARWKTDFQVEGKNIALIGNAASGMQVVSAIADKVASLHVFQRSPNYIVPSLQENYSALFKWMLRHVPGLMRFLRTLTMHEVELATYLLQNDSRRVRDFAKWLLFDRYLNNIVKDPGLRAKLSPTEAPGCRRVLFSNEYFHKIQRPNVQLITDGIERVTEDGIVSRTGVTHKVDAIVLATGFHTVDFLAPMTILGRDGVNLHAEAWKDGAEAYRGVCVPKFPNMYIMYGPTTNLSHSSVLLMIEAQATYTMKLLKLAMAQRVPRIEVSQTAHDRYMRMINETLKNTVFVAGCGGWYKNAAGRVITQWPKSVLAYQRLMGHVEGADFEPKIQTMPRRRYSSWTRAVVALAIALFVASRLYRRFRSP